MQSPLLARLRLELSRPRFPILTGTVLRCAVLFMSMRHTANALFLDNYMSVAYRWMTEHRYSHTNFPPLTAWLCRLAIETFGGGAPGAFLLFQCILSCATLVLTYLAARALTGSMRVGVAATWIAALDPLCLVIPAFVLTETTYMFLLTLFLFLVAEACASRTTRRRMAVSFSAGLALGILVLCRETGYLVGVSTMLGLAAFDRVRGHAFQSCALLFAGALIPVVPWCLEMQAVYGHFATSSSSAYNMAALLIRPAKVLSDGRDPPGMLSPWAADLATEPYSDNPFVIADHARAIALRFAREHKALVVRTFLWGALLRQVAPGDEFVASLLHPISGEALPPYDSAANPKFLQEPDLVPRATLSFVRLLVFLCTVVGIWYLVRQRKAWRPPPALWVCLIVLGVTNLALGPIHGGRYLCNLLPAVYPFAGVGALLLCRRALPPGGPMTRWANSLKTT